jgi:hypothetical protein
MTSPATLHGDAIAGIADVDATVPKGGGRPIRRVAIVGTTGSGKSVLANRLGEVLSLPPIELDALFWMPDWQPALIELFRQRVEAATTGEQWIIAGNYAQVRDLVWGRADTLIWLDFPLRVVLWRLLRRTVRRIVARENLWSTGNQESWRTAFFSRHSILLWALKTHRKNGERFRADIDSGDWGELGVCIFRSPRQLDRWLRDQTLARA